MTNKEFEELNMMSTQEEWGHKFTKYDIDVERISSSSKEALVNDGYDLSVKLFLTEAEMNKYGVYDEAIIFDGDSHFALELFAETVKKCVKDAKHYMVFRHHLSWDGLNQADFFDDLDKAIENYADVEGSMYFVGVYNKGKGLKVRVYNHENPRGFGMYLVALNDKEYTAFSKSVVYADFKDILGC